MRDDELTQPAAGLGEPTPVDPDVDLRVTPQRRELSGHAAAVLGAIALGGMLGSVARHAVSVLLPATGDVPWSTVVVNVTGCLLIGVLMVLVVEGRGTHRLVRPFLGVGVLGGYTTFSTYTVDAQVLVADGRPAVALGYLAGTVAAALLAVQLGVVLTRALAARPPGSRVATHRRGTAR